MSRWILAALGVALFLAACALVGVESYKTRLVVERLADQLGLSRIRETQSRVTLMVQYSTTIDCPALGGPTTITTTCEAGESPEACFARHKKAVAAARAGCQ